MENINQSEIGGPGDIDSGAKKPGRKPGKPGRTAEPVGSDSGTGTGVGTDKKPRKPRSPKSDSLGLIPLAPILVMLHSQIAGKLGEEWAMEMDEAERIDTAIQDVLALYAIKLTKVQAAWANLAFVLMTCYGPRIVMHVQKKKTEQHDYPVPYNPEMESESFSFAKQNGHPDIPGRTIEPVFKRNG